MGNYNSRIFQPSRLARLVDSLYRALLVRPVMAWQAWRCERCKQYLLRHDSGYRSSFIDNEIVTGRIEHYNSGGSPADPSLPDRWSVKDELPPMAWPHN